MSNRQRITPTVTALEDRSVPATLTGVAYNDLNGDNKQDAAEPGLAGVVVGLDVNSSGIITSTTTTDAAGKYSFENVPNGNHHITAYAPPGSTLDQLDAQFVVNSSDPAAVTDTVVGVPLRATGFVAGSVYADLNADNMRQASEPGLAGIVVGVDTNADGKADFNTTTGSDGSYRVANIPDGLSKITVVAPAGYQALQSPVADIVVAAAAPTSTPATAFVPTTAISGQVNFANTTAGLAGVKVTLDAVEGAPGTGVSTTTDTNGVYYFANVAPGVHTVKVDAPAGTLFGTADGKDTLTTTVTAPPGGVGAGGVVAGRNFGLSYAGSATGRLYADANANGQYEGGTDTAVAPSSVTVDLFGKGKPVAVTPVAQADGSYRIDGLPDGTHFVTVTPPAGYTAGGPTRTQVTVANGVGVAIAPSIVVPSGTGTPTTPTTPTVPTTPGTPTTPTVPTTPGTPTTPTPPATPTAAVPSGIALAGSGGIQTYTFAPQADGTLKATPVRNLAPAGGDSSSVATADVNGDGTADLITGTGAGVASSVSVFDGKSGTQLSQFAGFEAAFTGGVNVAAGDFNGDGKADIVVSAGFGGGPRVRVFDAAQVMMTADPTKPQLLADFFAIEDTRFRGGARVAVGDLNRDGRADLAVAAGKGGGPRVSVWDGNTLVPGKTPIRAFNDFFAYEVNLRNGAVVGIGDVNGDGANDLVTGAGPGGSPRVTVFSGVSLQQNLGAQTTRVADFFVGNDSTSRGGTTLSVKDLDGDGKADIVATNGTTASVVTAANIVKNYLNPTGVGPVSALDLSAVGDSKGVSVG